MTKIEKLAAIQNYATRYEVVMTTAEGEMLVCYTPRKSNAGLVSAVQNRGLAIVKAAKLAEDVRMTVSKGVVSIGAVKVAFSGRTQREAICNGELTSVSIVKG